METLELIEKGGVTFNHQFSFYERLEAMLEKEEYVFTSFSEGHGRSQRLKAVAHSAVRTDIARQTAVSARCHSSLA